LNWQGKTSIIRRFRNPPSQQENTLANTAQSKKRARQAIKRNEHNVPLRSRYRSAVKKVLTAIASGDKGAAQAAYKDAVSLIDKTETKGLIHKNKAARHKSRLNTRVRAM